MPAMSILQDAIAAEIRRDLEAEQPVEGGAVSRSSAGTMATQWWFITIPPLSPTECLVPPGQASPVFHAAKSSDAVS